MSTPNASAPLLPRHLLCGLDVEGRAHPAVQAAVWLAETLGAEVEFTHAFPPRPLLWGKKDDMPEWVAGTEAAGRVLRESLREALRQAPTELGLRTNADALRFHVASGHPAHVLLDHARTSHADLIVLGPHQKHGRLDFGGTARGVLAHAAHGVWVQPARPKLVKRILVPVDLSETSLAALRLARDPSARAAYDRALELDGRSALAHLGRGLLSLAEDDVQGAERDLGRALELHPRLAQAWLERGLLRLMTGGDAEADLARARELLPPGSPDAARAERPSAGR